jgi:16S rRNA (cytidine1402-2'-O)-methyltransferase
MLDWSVKLAALRLPTPGANWLLPPTLLASRLMPHIGPSALLLTLMASGFEGQRFAFAGYLPAQPQERSAALRRLEARSAHGAETQLWIETPYRAQALFATALQVLQPTTSLAAALRPCRSFAVDWLKNRSDSGAQSRPI